MPNETPRSALDHAREELLVRVQRVLDAPMVVLSFVWLAIIIVQFVRGGGHALRVASNAIWLAFVLDFVVQWLVAPRKLAYVRHNWLVALSLLLPALRIARVAQIVRLLRVGGSEVQLVRVVGAVDRGMAALGASMGRRGFRYVLVVTLIVTLVGAAGMLAFERPGLSQAGLSGYGGALWWTAMLLTTIGSQFWPSSAAGQLLCLLLSIYALGVLGYFTAALASFFVGRDAQSEAGEVAGEQSIRAPQAEVRALREELRAGNGPVSTQRAAARARTAARSASRGSGTTIVRPSVAHHVRKRHAPRKPSVVRRSRDARQPPVA